MFFVKIKNHAKLGKSIIIRTKTKKNSNHKNQIVEKNHR